MRWILLSSGWPKFVSEISTWIPARVMTCHVWSLSGGTVCPKEEQNPGSISAKLWMFSSLLQNKYHDHFWPHKMEWKQCMIPVWCLPLCSVPHKNPFFLVKRQDSYCYTNPATSIQIQRKGYWKEESATSCFAWNLKTLSFLGQAKLETCQTPVSTAGKKITWTWSIKRFHHQNKQNNWIFAFEVTPWEKDFPKKQSFLPHHFLVPWQKVIALSSRDLNSSIIHFVVLFSLCPALFHHGNKRSIRCAKWGIILSQTACLVTSLCPPTHTHKHTHNTHTTHTHTLIHERVWVGGFSVVFPLVPKTRSSARMKGFQDHVPTSRLCPTFASCWRLNMDVFIYLWQIRYSLSAELTQMTGWGEWSSFTVSDLGGIGFNNIPVAWIDLKSGRTVLPQMLAAMGIFVHKHTRAHVHKRAHTDIHTRTRARTHTRTHTHTRTQTYTQERARAHTQEHTHTLAHRHTHKNARAHTHKNTHTHTQ